MQYQFTPAAQRAVHFAAQWMTRDGCEELQTPAVLLGLLAESECRAAIILAGQGVDAAAVHRRWPELIPRQMLPDRASPPWRQLSAEVELSLRAACQRLAECSPPLELATEHLLLGLVAADHEVSGWLRQQGLQADALEAEIRKLYGHRPGPLPLEREEGLGGGSESRHAPRETEETADNPQARPVVGGYGICTYPPPRGGRNPWELQAPQGPHPNSPPPGEEIRLLRVVDAAANRAREGLRAAEDYVRFVLDDRHLTGLCKQLRHDLAAALGRISIEHRLAARQTQADVGTALATQAEGRRESTASVLSANLTRLQEALRSLEEFAKLLDVGMAAELKQLRYRSYTLQRAAEITRNSLERLARARLCVLIDGRPSQEEFERLAGSLVEAGVHLIQLRDKALHDRRLLQRARLLHEVTAGSDTLFIINDRPDLAVLCRADGVHVGQEELSVKDARTVVGPEALIGVSTHTLQQARQAQLDGANYIGVGPVFPSGTKHFEEIPGVGLLRAVAAEIRLPAFAIGGITRENLPEVLATGFTRVAVAGAITAATYPATEVREMLANLAL
jgi:thiamine-phosphate pyrophosphorylase